MRNSILLASLAFCAITAGANLKADEPQASAPAPAACKVEKADTGVVISFSVDCEECKPVMSSLPLAIQWLSGVSVPTFELSEGVEIECGVGERGATCTGVLVGVQATPGDACKANTCNAASCKAVAGQATCNAETCASACGKCKTVCDAAPAKCGASTCQVAAGQATCNVETCASACGKCNTVCEAPAKCGAAACEVAACQSKSTCGCAAVTGCQVESNECIVLENPFRGSGQTFTITETSCRCGDSCKCGSACKCGADCKCSAEGRVERDQLHAKVIALSAENAQLQAHMHMIGHRAAMQEQLMAAQIENARLAAHLEAQQENIELRERLAQGAIEIAKLQAYVEAFQDREQLIKELAHRETEGNRHSWETAHRQFTAKIAELEQHIRELSTRSARRQTPPQSEAPQYQTPYNSPAPYAPAPSY